MTRELPLEMRVERALVVAAQIVALHGDAYAPIFERLEREFEALRRRDSVADRARMLAARVVPQISKPSPAL